MDVRVRVRLVDHDGLGGEEDGCVSWGARRRGEASDGRRRRWRVERAGQLRVVRGRRRGSSDDRLVHHWCRRGGAGVVIVEEGLRGAAAAGTPAFAARAHPWFWCCCLALSD